MNIVNIVATVTLPQSLDLQKLRYSLPGIDFSPKVHWLKMRIQPEGAYVAFYRSGKFLVTGKSFEQINSTADKVITLLKNIDVNTDPWQLKIHNMVFTDRIEMNTNLENLMYSLDPRKASYEVEQFPALIYKDWGASFLLFSSGKTIILGVNNENDAREALDKFRNLINTH